MYIYIHWIEGVDLKERETQEEVLAEKIDFISLSQKALRSSLVLPRSRNSWRKRLPWDNRSWKTEKKVNCISPSQKNADQSGKMATFLNLYVWYYGHFGEGERVPNIAALTIKWLRWKPRSQQLFPLPSKALCHILFSLYISRAGFCFLWVNFRLYKQKRATQSWQEPLAPIRQRGRA